MRSSIDAPAGSGFTAVDANTAQTRAATPSIGDTAAAASLQVRLGGSDVAPGTDAAAEEAGGITDGMKAVRLVAATTDPGVPPNIVRRPAAGDAPLNDETRDPKGVIEPATALGDETGGSGSAFECWGVVSCIISDQSAWH
jgi:hypothetical protein